MTLMLNQNSGCVITNTCGGTGKALAAGQEQRTPGCERAGDAGVYYECFGVKMELLWITRGRPVWPVFGFVLTGLEIHQKRNNSKEEKQQ